MGGKRSGGFGGRGDVIREERGWRKSVHRGGSNERGEARE